MISHEVNPMGHQLCPVAQCTDYEGTFQKGGRIFQFYLACIRHATPTSTRVIHGSSIDSHYLNWKVCIPMIINLNLNNIGFAEKMDCPAELAN